MEHYVCTFCDCLLQLMRYVFLGTLFFMFYKLLAVCFEYIMPLFDNISMTYEIQDM